MERFADNCGWGHPDRAGAYRCERKKTSLTQADIGIGLCPCRFWVKKLEKPIKKTEKPSKSLF